MCLYWREEKFPDFGFIFEKIKEQDRSFFPGGCDDQKWFAKYLKMVKKNEDFLSFVLENRLKL